MQHLERLKSFIHNIVSLPNFIITPNEYVSVSYSVYYLSTIEPQIIQPNSNPYDSPFENLFEFICNFLDNEIKSSAKDIIPQYELYLKLIQKKSTVFTHICNTIEKRKFCFLKLSSTCSIQAIFCKLFFDNIFSQKINEVIDSGISSLESLFENYQTADLTSFHSLISLIYYASTADRSKNFYEIMTNQIYPKIQAVFTKYKSLDINLYPKIIPVLSHIVNSLESTSAKEFVCKSFYEIGIQPNLDKIKSIIFSYHGNDLFLKTPPPSEALLLSALSFYPTDSTKKIIIEIFNNTIKSFIVPLEKELIIRNLALKMLQLLQIQENFLNLLNDVTFRKVTNKVLSELLNKAKFSAKFGEKYPIALSYIVDTYLKRGNAFKSKVTQSNISRLLSLVYERDLFVSVHTCNLFYRIVTRSTIGISYEAKFLDSIAAVVLDENLKEARQIIDETRICTEPTLPNFSYIFTCLSFKPNKNFSNKFLLPREYNSLVGSATNLISKRFPSKKIEWSHYFATTEMRLKTTAGVSDLITSIPQYDILHLFEENGNLQIPINSLIDTIGITKSHLESVLKTLVSSKILLLTKKENGDQIISFNMNFQQKKAMIADNWSPKAVKPKNNDVSRFICVKAAVVRIMKANRMMNIRQLIDKTINDIACLFPTSTDEVKRSIDVLVEDGYLERKGDTHLAYIE